MILRELENLPIEYKKCASLTFTILKENQFISIICQYRPFQKNTTKNMLIIIVFFEDIPSIDEHINVKYEKDDIRLCTMQRSTPDQLIGIQFYYYRQDRFHYIELLSDCKSTLAYRAGLRNFDRIISINGVNIEKYRPKRCTKRFRAQSHLPVQMLVCSPATYAHYKLNDMSLHENLPTIQRLRPVFDISCN